MYKKEQYRQLGLTDFNQPLGLKMNPENRWIKKAATIICYRNECRQNTVSFIYTFDDIDIFKVQKA